MIGLPDNIEEMQPSPEEHDVRKGARVKPGGDDIQNAESEAAGSLQPEEGAAEGEEQKESIKNSK